MKLASGRDYPNTYRGFVAIAVEIRQPKGFGRVRMHHIPDASGEKTKDQYLSHHLQSYLEEFAFRFNRRTS